MNIIDNVVAKLDKSGYEYFLVVVCGHDDMLTGDLSMNIHDLNTIIELFLKTIRYGGKHGRDIMKVFCEVLKRLSSQTNEPFLQAEIDRLYKEMYAERIQFKI